MLTGRSSATSRLSQPLPAIAPLGPTGVLLVALTCFMWASSLVAARFGVLAGTPPLTLATQRVGLALLVLLLASALRGSLKPVPRHLWGWLALMAISHTALSYGLTFWAMRTLPAGVGMVLMSSQPFWVALLGHACFADERLSSRRLVGLALGFGGVVVIAAERFGRGGAWLDQVAVLAAALAWSVGTVLARRINWQVDTLTVTTWHFVPAGLVLIAAAVLLEGPALWQTTPSAALAAVYLALVPTAATSLLWFALLRRHGTARVTPFVFLQPPFAVAQGAFVLGEPLTLALALGVALVGAGILVVGGRWPVVRKQ